MKRNQTIEGLIERIKSSDDAVSGAAWQNAGAYGAPAVQPLAELMSHPEFELARKARRALYRVVRRGGYPWSGRQREAIEVELIHALDTAPAPVRRELAWMLSEIGGRRAIPPLAALLVNLEVREDARCVLTRHPAPEATAALKSAFANAPDDFKYALAESLRQRGETVEGYPSRKLAATAQTSVQPVPPKAK